MRLAAVTVLVFLVFAAAAHVALLWISPYWETDKQIEAGLKRGAASFNTLVHGAPPKAGRSSVPLANADTFSSRAYLDLSRGPLILAGTRPQSCSYWSVSVFAHNTDVVLIQSDRDTPDRVISIGLKTRDQAFATPVKTEAVLPSPRGVLLIRCFMRDRLDKAYLAQLDRERRQLSLRLASSGANG